MIPMTSPNDPIFFMHHCMVDKMWHEWQLRFPNQGYLPVSGGRFGQNLNELMSDTPVASIGSRPIDVLDSTAIGISYDQLLPGTPIIGPIVNPPALATNLTIDASPTTGRISAGGELDVYRFTVSSFGEYEIETAGDSDTFITLSGPNDPLNEVARNDDGGDNLNSKITLNLSAGVYHVSVRLYDPSTTGNYTIQVSSASTTSHIPEITVDAPATAAAISVRSESDVYRFRVVRRAYHTIETSGITDTFLTLSGPNDESLLIQQDDDSGSRFNSRIRRVLNAGEYYVRVRHFSPDATGSYSVSVLKR
jgi:tyrosinase